MLFSMGKNNKVPLQIGLENLYFTCTSFEYVLVVAAYVNDSRTNWDQSLDEAAFAINTSQQETPFQLIYGRTAEVFLI